MTSFDPKVVGKRVQELRRTAGYTQETFAAAIGRTSSSVERFEQGRTPKPGVLLKKMADVLGMSVPELLDPDAPIGGASSQRSAPLSERDERLVSAFRGNLRQIEDYLIDAADMPDHDRALIIASVEWAYARIEAGRAWDQQRRAGTEAGEILREQRRETANNGAGF